MKRLTGLLLVPFLALTAAVAYPSEGTTEAAKATPADIEQIEKQVQDQQSWADRLTASWQTFKDVLSEKYHQVMEPDEEEVTATETADTVEEAE
jgi:hypothetical protein